METKEPQETGEQVKEKEEIKEPETKEDFPFLVKEPETLTNDFKGKSIEEFNEEMIRASRKALGEKVLLRFNRVGSGYTEWIGGG